MHWLLLTFIAAMANALLVVLWKHFSGRADILLLIAMNNILSGVMVAGYALVVDKTKLVPDLHFWMAASFMAVCSVFILIFFSLALKSGPVSFVNPIFSGMLNLTVIILGVLIFAEKLTLLSGAGIAAVIAGVTMIAVG